jgi:hypothetical protein
MNYAEDAFAPRALTNLQFRVTRELHPADDPYPTSINPDESDFLEFAIFRDSGEEGPDGVWDGIDFLNPSFDPSFPMITWDAHGFPYEMPVWAGSNNFGGDVVVGPNGRNYRINDNYYDLNFVFDPNDPGYIPNSPFLDFPAASGNNPKFPFNEWPITGPTPNNGYLVMVRLSSAWTSGTSLGVIVYGARMQPYSDNAAFDQGIEIGSRPIGTDGALLDSLPDFTEGPISEEAGYSASFEVWDQSGWDDFFAEPGDRSYNRSAHSINMYTPYGEQVRPRWDVGDSIVNAVTGEWLDLRELFAIETWVPVVAINAHATQFGFLEPQDRVGLREVNLVVTDVGGDPFGPPGNGGFDPTEGLETMTATSGPSPSSARNVDYAFNGVWVYEDANGNGLLDVPANTGSVGVSFTDFPMAPFDFGAAEAVEPGLLEWEYVPFPPGGGDPWWKLRMTLAGIDRPGSFGNPDDGAVESIPDPYPVTERPRADYFVTMRADSGFTDISGVPGDGTGLAIGADMRAFIEPRRWQTGRPGSTSSAPTTVR